MPKLLHTANQKFTIAVPLSTHWGPASCEDVDCLQYLNGFALILSVDSQKDHIDYIRSLKDRSQEYAPGLYHRYQFTERQDEELLITFTFPPGQPCFRASTHKWQNGKPPLWIHGKEGNNRQLEHHHFKDLMNEEGYKLQREIKRG